MPDERRLQPKMLLKQMPITASLNQCGCCFSLNHIAKLTESSMSSTSISISARPKYPRGFRPRRGLNWGFLGLLYTSFYMCRYNLSLANKSISDEFGYTYSDMGRILSAWAL